MTYEQQFLDALKSIFIGAKVEGDSGYINLMKIKANYFEKGVFPVLMKDIDSACKPFEKGFREELFDKLHDFFQHYFSESGSIYFRNTAQHHNIYEKVYTDDRDVMLFWKTHMLYYVKTDRLFNSMEIEVGGEKFFFDVSGMELKRSNEKRELTYAFKSIKNGVITLTVGYSEKGRKTKIDEIVKLIKETCQVSKNLTGLTVPTEETLEKAFAVFQKQSEVDYFINKNAKAFLQEQFDLWMYQYIFKGESEFNELRLKQLQAMKGIATKIIDFIAQFEDELVKVWNKPKFALNSNYIITLDKIINHVAASRSLAKQSPVKQSKAKKVEIASDENQERPRTSSPQGNDILERIFKHKGMKDQIAEWIELGMVDKKFKLDMVLEKDVVGEPRNPQYQYLPLDTKYFKDLELDILALFDDPSTGSGQGLDAALDGWLIHSENYQALNTLLPKFQGDISCVYIDPPYNTGRDGFIYRDRFQHSNWLAMMDNRLWLTRDFLANNGAIFTSIDDVEQSNLRFLLQSLFGTENENAQIIWQKRSGPPNDKAIGSVHEFILSFVKDFQEAELNLLERTEENLTRFKDPDNDPRGAWAAGDLSANAKGGRFVKSLYYEIVNPKTGDKHLPPEGACWRFSKDKVERLIKEGTIYFGPDGKGRPKIKRYLKEIRQGLTTPTIWQDLATNTHARTEINNLFGENNAFDTPKPTKVIERIVSISTQIDEFILDYFGGSGTTAHAVMNLNRADGGKRKYILVEMGEHFNTVILPRVKKVAFSDKWKDGKAHEGKGISHFAKYFELEQYEDALKKARYEDAPLFAGTQDAYTSYAFLRDLKMLEAVKVNKKQNQVEVSLNRLYDGIDLAETLSCLTGKWIKRITKDSVEFQDGTSASLSAPEWDDVKPLIWW